MSDIQFVWEDRPYSIWASRELSKLVGSIEMEKIVFSDVVVTGECSICVTRGKKIGIFELNVRCKWEDEKREKGEITIPELSSVDVEDGDYVVNVTGGGDGKRIVREKIVPEIRKRVKVFSEQLLRAERGDGKIRKEEIAKETKDVKVVKIHKERSKIRAPSVPSSRPAVSVGPSKSVEVTIHVSDIDEKSVKSERYRFFRQLTLLENASVESVKEAAIASIVDQGWKSNMFPSVVLVGPMPLDGCTKRQICIMGSHKGFKRGTYLPSRRTLGKCLQNSLGNTLRVSPLDPRDALESAIEDAEEEEKTYREKEAKRKKKLAFKKKQKERRKREREAAAKTSGEKVKDMNMNHDVEVETEPESKTMNTSSSPSCYNWGVQSDSAETTSETKNQSYELKHSNDNTSSSLIIEDVTDEVDTLQIE